MTTEGEAFTTEEMDEMLSAAIDQDKQLIYYKDFAPLMLLEESQTIQWDYTFRIAFTSEPVKSIQYTQIIYGK